LRVSNACRGEVPVKSNETAYVQVCTCEEQLVDEKERTNKFHRNGSFFIYDLFLNSFQNQFGTFGFIMAVQLVRLKRGKNTFEVMTNIGSTEKWREEKLGIDNVLQSDVVCIVAILSVCPSS
jgi:hypothetical protein